MRYRVGDLLAVTTGLMLSPTGVDGLYGVVDGISGQQHMTHQLGRAAEEIRPYVLWLHPWLADIPRPEHIPDRAALLVWLGEVATVYGEYHDVPTMPFGEYIGREPIAELQEMVGDKPIIVVQAPESGGAS